MPTVYALLPDFLLILLGYALRRWLQLGDHFWGGLEKLVYFVLFPALLFGALVRSHIDPAVALPLLITGGVAMVIGMGLAVAARFLSPALSPMSRASQFQCAFRYNSYIGLAVAGSLHGAAGIAAMGLMTGGLVPLANVAAVWMMARHGSQGVMRELIRNPLVLATLAGLTWSFAELPFPDVGLKILTRMGDAAIALGLLAVGAALRLRGAVGRHGQAAAAWILFVKLAAMPMAAVLLGKWLALTGLYRDIVVIFAALPTASSAYILAQRMGGDGARVAWLISASTLMAMITLPIWLLVISSR